jgi:hypothetical protein
MEYRDIESFLSNYIAVYRPNKKTYSILQWHAEFHYWKRALLEPELQNNITIRTRTIPTAIVKININRSNTNENRFIKCIAYGKYLVYGTNCVPIIQCRSSSTRKFPLSTFAGEFACTATSEEHANLIGESLWTLRAEPEQLPVLDIITTVIEPLPQRIAWLVADDACKNGEICSITLETISPITASVTSCFHTFETNAIEKWLMSNENCPMCKKKTVATKAFIL